MQPKIQVHKICPDSDVRRKSGELLFGAHTEIGWLVFVDLRPGTPWPHPAAVIVDYDGEVYTYEVDEPPVIAPSAMPRGF